MTHVTEQEWLTKAENFQKRIKDNPYPENLQWYQDILARVQIGSSVLDVGCGMQYVRNCLPPDVEYLGIDPYIRVTPTLRMTAEELTEHAADSFDTVLAFASLDNCMDLSAALKGIRHVAKRNVVIVTGINIEPDHLHTVMVTRKDLTDVLGEPRQEIELTPNVFLFEFIL